MNKNLDIKSTHIRLTHEFIILHIIFIPFNICVPCDQPIGSPVLWATFRVVSLSQQALRLSNVVKTEKHVAGYITVGHLSQFC